MTRHAPDSRLHVLVVDGSAAARRAAQAMLNREKDLRVSTAADTLIALERLRLDPPQVVLLDLGLQPSEGLGFLRTVMSAHPLPVVACSSFAAKDPLWAMEALDQGAVHVLKTNGYEPGRLEELGAGLAQSVRGAAGARLSVLSGSREGLPRESRSITGSLPARTAQQGDPIIVVGASIGGPGALACVVSALPPDVPGLVAVLHLPGPLIRPLAARMDGLGVIRVKPAEPGAPVIRGQMLLASADQPVSVKRLGPGFVVTQGVESPAPHRGSAMDALFKSAAREAGPNALGVILSGVGVDGAEGLLQMKRAGATTVAQDEASSVVFEMPREAVSMGAADQTASLSALPATMVSLVGRILSRDQAWPAAEPAPEAALGGRATAES